MNMPTPCPRCGEIVEFDEMVQQPDSRELCCDSCRVEIDREGR